MRDVRIAELAGRQFNRVSRAQLEALGVSKDAIEHRVASGRLVIVEQGVLAIAPVLDSDAWGRWMGATLTQPGSLLSRLSAAVAWGALSHEGRHVTITRPGNGGPRVHGGIRVYRSTKLDADRAELNGSRSRRSRARCWTSRATWESGPSLARFVRPCGWS